ncbi:hypothetical protein MACH17_18460 [Phaeobacter inhibens]|uniref:hypothetical protein n=1 Tax=Phaeobacter inhibens TaxID=221822 RepID=UPI0027590E1C|nr:hypothetical protein [Phaeobacter inhibens]GLO70329.1 hypothetical protein MACH17_18460 [Phaeobacter inhibens]
MAITRNTNRCKVASLLNRAGEMRRYQIGRPILSYAERVEICHLLRRARELNRGMI